MSFLSRYFAPEDYDFQVARAKWLDEQLELSIGRERAKDKVITSLYNKMEKILLRYGDAMSSVAGKKGHFVADAVEAQDTPDEVIYTEDEMSRFRHYAGVLREEALALCDTDQEREQVPTIEEYVDKIAENPAYVGL